MGRKMEEADWADVYCTAKAIPVRGWSNLNIDVMHQNLGVEHNMLCYRSRPNIKEACGTTLMHPSATRAVRINSTDIDPNEAMQDVLTQYGNVIAQRESAVEAQNRSGFPTDLRTGWLLWQESLRQFLYFEEPMFAPDPNLYVAEWVVTEGSGSRRGSKNLWIYEKETGRKRYSVTTAAGVKIQPYFDVPPPEDPNLYVWTVIGEQLASGFVRAWLTRRTADALKKLVGTLDPMDIGAVIESLGDREGQISRVGNGLSTGDVIGVEVPGDAYLRLQRLTGGVNDEHNFQMLLDHFNA